MPKYEFRCNDTGKLFEIYASYQDYDPAKVVSPFTGSPNVSRVIRRIRVMRSESSRWDRMLDGDEAALDDLDDTDPQTLGRALRHFGHQMDLGDEMVPEFNEVIDRLESGQTPEEIEQTMDIADSGVDDDL